MLLSPTSFYTAHLAPLHQQLLNHDVIAAHLSGIGIRFDGDEVDLTDKFSMPFGDVSALEFVHLFSVFNGSRVHRQAEKSLSRDDAPPGLYFTVINNKIIQNQHKNRAGLVAEEVGATGLFIDALHVDHFFLSDKGAPERLGTFAFTLCAITAHLAGLEYISLIAAGGVGFDEGHIGYKVWPKLGFNADLIEGETMGAPNLEACLSVQDVIAVEPQWWEVHGSQRRMTFDLAANSRSWQKLIPYVEGKVSAGAPRDENDPDLQKSQEDDA